MNTALATGAESAPVSCEKERERIAACEEVLDSAELAIHRQAETIAALSDQNVALRKALQTAVPALEDANAWHKNPYLIFGLGFLGGALAHRELSR